MTFEQQVAQYLNQPHMKAQLKAHYKKMGGSAADSEAAKRYAEEAKQAIIDALPESLKNGMRPITINDFEPLVPRLNADGDYEIELRWKPEAIHRESLYEEGYPEGLENIVALFSTGNKPLRHSVLGLKKEKWSLMYHQYYIPAGYQRAADPFISKAVAAFNAKYAKNNVVLIAPDIYT